MIRKGKILAIDYGAKLVGLASGDFEFKIAFPRENIINRGIKDLAEQIKEIALYEDIKAIVLGWPYNMEEHHEENHLTKELNLLIETIKELLPEITIVKVDERLTTFQAKNVLRDRKKKKQRLDSIAAKIILERYFKEISTD